MEYSYVIFCAEEKYWNAQHNAFKVLLKFLQVVHNPSFDEEKYERIEEYLYLANMAEKDAFQNLKSVQKKAIISERDIINQAKIDAKNIDKKNKKRKLRKL